MSFTARVKDGLRVILGDSVTTTIHGWRFAYLARRTASRDSEMQFVAGFAPDGCVAIDVGANGADWTLSLARRVGPSGHVYAFEAHPYYAEATRKAIRSLRLSNVTLCPAAVGDSNGTVHLMVKRQRAASFSGRARIVESYRGEMGSTEEISMVRIDDVIAEHNVLDRVGFLKSDTEGFELAVLRGAAKTLRASRPVLFIEVGHGWMHGFSDDDLETFLREADYRIYAYDAAERRVVALDRLIPSSTQYGRNRLLLPKERASTLLH